MKSTVPVIIRQVCDPRLISRWIWSQSKDEDSVEHIQYVGSNGSHSAVKMSQLEKFLEDNDVSWANLDGDVRVP